MIPQAGSPSVGAPIGDYRRLVSLLASRAARWGSRDPEAAAQETLRRSLENPKSRRAVEYYLGDQPPEIGVVPEWRLEQLLAWLHVVLQYVVRDERSRAGFRRELPSIEMPDLMDRSPGALDVLLQREARAIVSDSFAALDRDYRKVLRLRLDGLKYGEIAHRMGVNENTVGTWISRGIRQLGRQIRRRMGDADGR